MPIYEYECSNCIEKFEFLQKINDQPFINCPVCNSSTLRKIVSASGFKLKGTGWYATDFKDQKKDSKKDVTNDKNRNTKKDQTINTKNKDMQKNKKTEPTKTDNYKKNQGNSLKK